MPVLRHTWKGKEQDLGDASRQLPFTDTRTGTPPQSPGHPRLAEFPPVSGLVPFTGGEVEMLVQIQEHLLKEAQSLALCFLTALKHLLHVLHVAGIVAVQLFQHLLILILALYQPRRTAMVRCVALLSNQ